jgi:hypothetical protein
MSRLSDYYPRSIAEKLYTPAMMRFDGTTGYYDKASVATSGNLVTAVARFKVGTSTNDQKILSVNGTSYSRLQLTVKESDHASVANKLQLLVKSSTDTILCNYNSSIEVTDNSTHTVFAAYDGTNGTAVLYVDGVEVGDATAPIHALTTGTVASGSGTVLVGATGGPAQYFGGDIGFVGYADAYLTNWSDFMDSHGHPKEIDTSSWNGWGSQPLFWNPAGDMTNNLGSAGDMTKNGTIEVASGATYDTRDPQYRSGRMEYDGTSGYYQKTGVTTSGNDVTVVCSFKCASFTGGGIQRLFQIEGSSPSGDLRAAAIMYSSDSADTDRAGKILVQSQNTAGTNIARLISPSGFINGQPHTLFYSFDGDAGAATFIIDGADVDDTGNTDRIAPTTGTLDTGSTGILTVGNDSTNYFKGDIGYFGWRDAYLTNWSDFMLSDGTPKLLDESGWAEWGAQPLFWNAHGDLVNNKGSAGAMTKNGTINVSDGAYRVRRLEPAYTPAMMEFDGSSGGYQDVAYTPSGNKITGVIRFRRSAFSTNDYEVLYAVSGTDQRSLIMMLSNDYAAAPARQGKIQLQVQNDAAAVICRVVSKNVVADGQVHTLFWEFDGDAGTAKLIIDGVDADDTGNADRIAPTTGTLETASQQTAIGYWGAGGKFFGGDIGYCGHRDVGGLDYTNFMDTNGNLKALDESGWTEWGAQPLFWNEHGEMTNNLGSAGAMTKTGTIVVGKGGN